MKKSERLNITIDDDGCVHVDIHYRSHAPIVVATIIPPGSWMSGVRVYDGPRWAELRAEGGPLRGVAEQL